MIVSLTLSIDAAAKEAGRTGKPSEGRPLTTITKFQW